LEQQQQNNNHTATATTPSFTTTIQECAQCLKRAPTAASYYSSNAINQHPKYTTPQTGQTPKTRGCTGEFSCA
jgi:hypothetical protein